MPAYLCKKYRQHYGRWMNIGEKGGAKLIFSAMTIQRDESSADFLRATGVLVHILMPLGTSVRLYNTDGGGAGDRPLQAVIHRAPVLGLRRLLDDDALAGSAWAGFKAIVVAQDAENSNRQSV
jgi:hypothetical protein